MRQAKRRGSANGRRRFAFLGGESEEKTENSEFSLTWLGASTENNEKRKTSALTVGGGDSVAASEEKTTFFFKNDKIVAEADGETPINFPEDIPETRTSRSGSRR